MGHMPSVHGAGEVTGAWGGASTGKWRSWNPDKLTSQQSNMIDYWAGRGQNAADAVSFYGNNFNNPRQMQKNQNLLDRINKRLGYFGRDAIGASGQLTPEQLNQQQMAYAGKSPKKAAEMALMNQLANEDEAMGNIDDLASQFANDPMRAQLYSILSGQLANPDRMDELFKQKDAQLRSQAAGASRNYEQRLRQNMGGRGLGGSPYQSGAGMKQLGGYEAELERSLQGGLRQNSIDQILMEQDMQTRDQSAAAAFINSDLGRSLGLESLRSNVLTHMPSSEGGSFSSLSALLAAIESGDQSFMDQYGGMIGDVGGTLGAAAMPLLLSDRRVKTDIEQIGCRPDGIKVYKFRYVWDSPGVEKFGVIAQEAMKIRPDAVVDLGGILAVNYGVL